MRQTPAQMTTSPTMTTTPYHRSDDNQAAPGPETLPTTNATPADTNPTASKTPQQDK